MVWILTRICCRFLDLLTQKRRQTADALSAATTSNTLQAPAPNAPLTKQIPTNQVQAAATKVEIAKPSISQPVKPIASPSVVNSMLKYLSF